MPVSRRATRWLASVVASVVVLGMLASPSVAAEPGRRVLVGDYSKKLLAIIGPTGQIEWQHKVDSIHDAWKLPDGNVLLQTSWQKLVEVTPDGKVVWQYDSGKSNGNQGKPVEVHAFQRLADGVTMIAESGPCRIIEVDRDGKLLKEVKLQVAEPHPHYDTRLARKLASGNYLACHEGPTKKIREYDPSGKVVWEYDVKTKAYSAERLANGNTLIGAGDGHRVIEVNPKGEVVWSVEEKDLPGITLHWVTMVQRLANGNTVIVNCHAGPENPQMIEVTPEKKVVWKFQDFERFGNSVAVGKVLE